MASAVDIANLALANIGETANVSSLTEGSVQADLCNRFYPMARDTLLEMALWNFATRRADLAETTNPSTSWLYAYAMPAGVVTFFAVLPAEASDDYQVISTDISTTKFATGYVELPAAQYFTTQPFTIETASDGSKIILTNTPEAIGRYTVKITDTAKFSALFTVALSWLLSSMIVGSLIKGDQGAAMATRCAGMFNVFKNQAMAADANQRKVSLTPVVPWVAGR